MGTGASLHAGQLGLRGGKIYQQAGNRLPYGSDRNILGTDYDALYETQRLGLTQFRADVPDGEYEITLHFAEPQSEQLVYNLAGAGAASSASAKQERAFSVLINGQGMLPELSTKTYLLPLQAASFKVGASARGKQGIRVEFKAKQGEAVLNGIQIKRLY